MEQAAGSINIAALTTSLFISAKTIPSLVPAEINMLHALNSLRGLDPVISASQGY